MSGDGLSAADRTAERERRLLRAIMESTSEGVYSTDLEGRIVSFNAAAERISGRRAAEVVGRTYREALALGDEAGSALPEDARPCERCIATKEPAFVPLLTLRRPDGGQVPITLSTSPILDPLGSPASCVTVFRDVSRDRELEEMKADLISLVSHELRTPLGHIRAFASTLLQDDVEWDTATRREFLRDIERETQRLDRLISDILDMSRAQSGGASLLERHPAAPDTVVRAGIERLGELLEGRELEVDVPSGLPAVWVDVDAMTRVVSNLVENAAKYSPPGTPIRVAVGADDRCLRLLVEDRGPGIAPADRERVFEKFFRVTPPGIARTPGVGLGLAICRSIVAAHGGAVWVEDRGGGGGARFVVMLPFGPTPSEAGP